MGRKHRNASERVTVEELSILLTGDPWAEREYTPEAQEEGGNDFPPQTFPV